MSRTAHPAVLPTYARLDVTFVEGVGAWLVADDGRTYLDFAAGIAVVGLGHGHAAVTAAARDQLERLWHVSNLYWTQPMSRLADRLSERFGGAEAFFCNSGAEAVEAALKYARKATGRQAVLALEGSFHGRTLGALGVTGQPGKRAAFEPLPGPVRFARPNDVESLGAGVDHDIGLVLLEPVLGEGGVVPLTPEFLQAAAEIAAQAGAFLCLDEIQTGVGRTGTFFAFEQSGVRPDMVTLAKGLANGLPLGCLLVAEEATGGFEPGDHASTFGGNPVACAAACAVCDAVDDDLLGRVRDVGAELRTGLARLDVVRDVRGLAPRGRRARPPGRACGRGMPRARAARDVRRRACTSAHAAADRRPRRRRRSSRHPQGGACMTDKTRRQGAILRLIRERAISTQSEPRTPSGAAGHEVVQTTVSRDVHELGLRKVRTGTGQLAYAPPDAPDADGLRALGSALRRWALDFQASGNILVILTPRGYAAPLADAIDASGLTDSIGTVAGDNTIIVVAREGVSGAGLADQLRNYAMEGAA